MIQCCYFLFFSFFKCGFLFKIDYSGIVGLSHLKEVHNYKGKNISSVTFVKAVESKLWAFQVHYSRIGLISFVVLLVAH